jgi:hypothetical protein
MLDQLGASAGALVIMAAGIASAANLAWLRANGYGYLLVSPEAARVIDPDRTTGLPAPAATRDLRQVWSADGQETSLYCHSPERTAKEEALAVRRNAALEAGLRRLAEAIANPGADHCLHRLQERVNRLRERSGAGGQGYRIELHSDASGREATALTWERLPPLPASGPSVPGMLCLRTSETDWDTARMWEAYSTLVDLEAVFTSLRPGPGLRPFNHPSEECAEARLFISVLAYQCIQLVRHYLKRQGIHASWQSLRQTLTGRCRVTMSVRRGDGRTLHLRATSRAELAQLEIYRALGIDPDPGSVQTTVV